MGNSFFNRPTGGLFLNFVFLAAAAAAAPIDPADIDNWSVAPLTSSVAADRAPGQQPVELILDDGSREADVGLSDVAAFQFLWFNQFERPFPGIDLEEIQVLFPPGPEIVPGAEIQLVVYFDADRDPSNGAELLTAFDDVIQVVDGTTFSVYPVDPPLRVIEEGDILIGVVNRFVESGVSPPSRPAALDTTTDQGRSWVALWTGDPPSVPDLPPDLFLSTIDFLEPGNWMIRGSGTPVPVVTIPTLGRIGLTVLVLFVGLVGAIVVRRRVD